MILIGAGVNQWYHSNLTYRAAITGLVLCGCVGRNGGGLNPYVGQEKVAPFAPWATLAFALDWGKPPRLQNTSSFHYLHSDQWRYEGRFTEYHQIETTPDSGLAHGHTMDVQNKAVRMGWLPLYPQFNRNCLELVKEAEKEGARSNEEIILWVVKQLKEGNIRFSIEDPGAPENWPRLWFIWRGNALMSSAKGHEYFLKHYLGTHNALIADEKMENPTEEVVWRNHGPQGKIDLVVDINFRMDTSALYSDIILPSATWYEKDDLNSTDLHSFIHPMQSVVSPDNNLMLTLSRGLEPLWLNDKDAREARINDNDWVEGYNDHGVVVTRTTVSARIPPGICMLYHSPERTISVPKSP